MQGQLVAIHISPTYRSVLQKLERAEVVTNRGFIGDHHACPDTDRQILVLAQESLAEVNAELGTQLQPGMLRENLSTQGIPVQQLIGKCLRIGESVILELKKSCTPCSRMDEIRLGLREKLSGRRGILAKVVQGGWVRVGDLIQVI
ncbi:MOSC domain-containing protein [Candidatus Acetothermia bacterium]|nr:MOSC domain-containing protein [Candidatus Acetothermia bacterium]